MNFCSRIFGGTRVQPNGHFSGNLLTIQHILHEGLDTLLVPHYYDFENPAFRPPSWLYYYASSKIIEVMGTTGVAGVQHNEWLWDYLLGLSQQT